MLRAVCAFWLIYLSCATVDTLSFDSLGDFLGSHEHTVILFDHKQSFACQSVRKIFKALADKTSRNMAHFGSIDCSAHRSVCDSFEITAFPTVYYARNGAKRFRYEGPRVLEILEHIPMFIEKSEPEERSTKPFWGGQVVELTPDTFAAFVSPSDKSVKNQRSALVIFYTPWCEQSKRIRGVVRKLSQDLHEQAGGVIGALDVTKYPNFMTEHSEVKAYPTYQHFRHGKLRTSGTGVQTYTTIAAFFDETWTFPESPSPTRAPEPFFDQHGSITTLTPDTLNAAVSGERRVLVMFYKPTCSGCIKHRQLFEDAARAAAEGSSTAPVFASLDCAAYPDVCDRAYVSITPTYLHYRRGMWSAPDETPMNIEDFARFVAATAPAPPPPPSKPKKDL